MRIWNFMLTSVEERHHAEARLPGVLVPELTVLRLAALLVAPGAMRKKAAEPQRQQVRDDGLEAGGERERAVHHDLAGVVQLAPDAPPTGDQQLAAERLRGPAPDARGAIAMIFWGALSAFLAGAVIMA